MTTGAEKIAMRDSARIDENGKMTIEEFMAAGGGPESLSLRV
jgi:hypothetical protein